MTNSTNAEMIDPLVEEESMYQEYPPLDSDSEDEDDQEIEHDLMNRLLHEDDNMAAMIDDRS